MTTYYLSDALSLASIKAQKENRRYTVDEARQATYRIRPAAPLETPDIYIEPDGTVVKVKKEEKETK